MAQTPVVQRCGYWPTTADRWKSPARLLSFIRTCPGCSWMYLPLIVLTISPAILTFPPRHKHTATHTLAHTAEFITWTGIIIRDNLKAILRLTYYLCFGSFWSLAELSGRLNITHLEGGPWLQVSGKVRQSKRNDTQSRCTVPWTPSTFGLGAEKWVWLVVLLVCVFIAWGSGDEGGVLWLWSR